MTWLRIEDTFAENEKVSDLSDRSFRLHVTALCYCARNLTDGRVSERAAKVCGAVIGASRVYRNVAELVDAGLWIKDEEGYLIKDFLEYNPSAGEVKERKKSNAERQKKWRESHRDEEGKFTPDNGVRNAVRNALHNAAPSRPGPAQAQEVQEPADPADDDYGRAGAIKRLLTSLRDKDDQTGAQIRHYIETRKLAVADIEWARECATGPGVRSPTAVAVAELQKRAGERTAA